MIASSFFPFDGRDWPDVHRDNWQAEADFPLLVLPGLDPGIPTTAGVRGDHRVKPGDDDENTAGPRPAMTQEKALAILTMEG